MKRVIQIVPHLPPKVSGVGDYAKLLVEQLYIDWDVRTNFLLPKLAHDVEVDSSFTQVGFIEAKSVNGLFESLLRCTVGANLVVLHYVGYGYSQNGSPTWLIDGLEYWKAKYPTDRLVTMFHEIAASGPPWSRAFWSSSRQKHLAQRLVQISDRILTSKRSYAEILQSYAPERFATIPSLPVFSTVGELQNPSNLSERTRRLVIFGGRSKRSKVYKGSLEQLRQICRYLNIRQIFDIGSPLDSLPTNINTVPITVAGCLSREEISAIFADSIAGFFSYHPAFLGKSTIFAAYCAHRVIPVSANMSDLSEEGLQPGRHYALPNQYNTEKNDMALMQAISDNAFAWYQGHSLSKQAQAYCSLLSDLEVTQP